MRLLDIGVLREGNAFFLSEHDVTLDPFEVKIPDRIKCLVFTGPAFDRACLGYVREIRGVRSVGVARPGGLTFKWVPMPNLDEAIIYLKLLGGTRG